MAIDPTTGSAIPDPNTAAGAPAAAPPTTLNGAYVNPAYATPQQIEQLRMYSYMLGKNAATMPVHRWTQGLGQIANSVMAGLVGNQADKQSQAALDAGNQALAKVYSPAFGGGSSSPTSSSTPTSDDGSNPMEPYRESIKNIESGSPTGNYGAIGPKTDSGDRAYGAYQVMGNNVPQWTKEVLGQSMTPEQFRANPAAQDAVFDAKFGQAMQQTGNSQDAASVWFTGRPLAQGGNSSDHNLTGNQYVDKFNKGLASYGQRAPANQVASNTTTASDAPQPGMGTPSGNSPPAMVQALRGNTPAQPQQAQGTPSPQVIAALRGGGASPPQQVAQMGDVSPQDVANVLSNPMLSEEQKNAVRTMVTPQMMGGLFNSQYQTTPLALQTGNAPKMVFNPGQVTTGKYGGQEIGQVSQSSPSGVISTQPIVPGTSVQVQPPAGPQPMAGRVSPGASTAPPMIAPGDTGMGPDSAISHLASAGGALTAAANLAPSIQKDNIDAMSQSNNLIPQIQKHVQDLNTFEGILKSSTDGGKTLPLGALADKVQNWDSIANTFGIGDKRVLESLELLRKNGELSAQDIYGTIPGVNGHATNDALASAHSASPSTGVSLGGNLGLIDELRRADQLKLQYHQERASALSHGMSGSDFNNQWQQKIQSPEGAVPLSKMSYGNGSVTGPDGSKIPVKKYPSTEAKGWSWFANNDPRLQ